MQLPSFINQTALFQLLKSQNPEETNHCQHGVYFEDGQRRVDYILNYNVKKSSRGRSTRQSANLLTETAVTCSLRRGPKHSDKHLHLQQKSCHQKSPEDDVELGSSEETNSSNDDHKTFRREEFERKLRDVGLELEKDEDVSQHPYLSFLFSTQKHHNLHSDSFLTVCGSRSGNGSYVKGQKEKKIHEKKLNISFGVTMTSDPLYFYFLSFLKGILIQLYVYSSTTSYTA